MLGFGPKGFYDDLTSSVRFHRILRRGREYGSELRPEQALAPAPPNEQPRGINFICLNANISRQFEFLQNAWISNAKFAGLTGETDPLLGNRERMAGYCRPSANFTMQKENGLRYPLSGLPQFVTVRGGAYFFLPTLVCPITGDFSVPKEGNLRSRLSNLPQFVTVRGAAYFFLPSLRALRYFAAPENP